MSRLKEREIKRYGSELETNALIKKNSEDFLNWAEKYDDPCFNGRSIKSHTEWIKLLSCPILKIDGALSLPEKLGLIASKISQIQ